MPHENIIFFGKKVVVKCDGLCNKAWGISSRPRNKDYSFKDDSELETAPTNPGTYEGGQGKPHNSAAFPNKWCVRECERCEIINCEVQ